MEPALRFDDYDFGGIDYSPILQPAGSAEECLQQCYDNDDCHTGVGSGYFELSAIFGKFIDYLQNSAVWYPEESMCYVYEYQTKDTVPPDNFYPVSTGHVYFEARCPDP